MKIKTIIIMALLISTILISGCKYADLFEPQKMEEFYKSKNLTLKEHGIDNIYCIDNEGKVITFDKDSTIRIGD